MEEPLTPCEEFRANHPLIADDIQSSSNEVRRQKEFVPPLLAISGSLSPYRSVVVLSRPTSWQPETRSQFLPLLRALRMSRSFTMYSS